ERIAWVGPRVELPEAYRAARVRGFPQGLLLPAFVNAHCHLALTGMLGQLPGRAEAFAAWLRGVIAEQSRWTPEVTRLATRAGLDLLAASGCAAVADMSRAPDPETARESGLRARLLLEVIAFPAARAAQTADAAAAWLD